MDLCRRCPRFTYFSLLTPKISLCVSVFNIRITHPQMSRQWCRCQSGVPSSFSPLFFGNDGLLRVQSSVRDMLVLAY